jgi:hypothetical protein
MTWASVLFAVLLMAAIAGAAWSLVRRRRKDAFLSERTDGREFVVTAEVEPLASEAPDLETVLGSGEVPVRQAEVRHHF